VAVATRPLIPAEPRPPAGIQLGFSLYGMKSLPLAEVCEVCAKIGYESVELALNPGFPADPKQLPPATRRELGRRLKDLNLALAGLMDNLSLLADPTAHRAHLDRIQAAAELARDLAPQTPPILETVLGGKPAEWENVKTKMAEQLRAWAEVAGREKITLAIKPHVGSAAHLPAHALWLLEQARSPWIKLAFDQSHYQLRGLPLADTLQALLPHTSFIHVKDADGDAAKFQFLLPGEGKTDYADYFARLRKANWRGPVVVEVSGMIFNKPGYDPIAAAKRCFAKLDAARKAAS
jgi:inosose dehydratase